MAWDLLLWLLCFFSVGSLLGILVYQLMCLSDLEFDYINPFDSSSRINKTVLPEFVTHAALGGVYLLTGHWLLFLLNAPLVYYHARLYMNQKHMLDVTEIFNLLDREKKYRMVKLAFYLLLFLIVVYNLVVAAVNLILEHDAAALDTRASFTGIHSDMSMKGWKGDWKLVGAPKYVRHPDEQKGGWCFHAGLGDMRGNTDIHWRATMTPRVFAIKA